MISQPSKKFRLNVKKFRLNQNIIELDNFNILFVFHFYKAII